MNSIAHQSPIVREIVWRIIARTDFENTKDKHRIDSDSVPHIPHQIHTQRNFQESILQHTRTQEDSKSMQYTVKPIIKPQITQPIQQTIPAGYGKLTALINDPTISHISCKGPETQIVVIRRGRDQPVNVVLSQEELDSLLKFVSERARIPLVEGIFKVDVDNMLFFAVIEKGRGTTLMIKKNFQISSDLREAFQ